MVQRPEFDNGRDIDWGKTSEDYANWRGRIRALRGIGATLTPGQVENFDREHDELLKNSFGDEFVIPHRIIARMLKHV